MILRRAKRTIKSPMSIRNPPTSYTGKEVALGDLTVNRVLPVRGRRMVGPWCFLDRFGPLSFTEGMPMDVAPHPHIGLQTVSWLLEGEIAHDDSLRSEALLRPGGVNVMTSGHAIAHAERTPREHTGKLNGVQLWTALPESRRHGAAAFQHLAEVPRVESAAGLIQVFAGSIDGRQSPAEHFSPIVGAELRVHRGHDLALPLDAAFEHALLVLDGDVALEGQPLEPRLLYYMEPGRTDMALASSTGARVLLVGGTPFDEPILMWWNFVARTPEEIREAREDWESHKRFGEVPAYQGPRLPAPEVLRLAERRPANPMS
jgi:redox-sensitive bicupin YhaK (pirin superfamily)